MDQYVTMFQPIPWQAVGYSVVQTFTLYWMVIMGLKVTGRRVFGQLGPQDIIVLLLIAESCNLGMVHEQGGYWATVASVATILATGGLVERCPPLRNLLEDSPVELAREGKPDPIVMKRSLVQEDDLESTAREYGFAHYDVFERMTLESNGRITGVLKPHFRPIRHPYETSDI